MIRILDSADELEKSVSVIRESFAGVALEFGLTGDNCPTHPSFQTLDRLRLMKDRGVELYGLFENAEQVGFVAVEEADDDLYYLERLAVLPGHRHRGRGRAMVEFVEQRVRHLGGKRISVGIIAEGRVLKDWYESLGFRETETKHFETLPFEVCFMDKDVAPGPTPGNIL